MTATGGVQPYTWSILSDTPDTGAWLSISPNGVLSGTPTAAETESVIIKVTDTNGRSNSKLFSLGVIQPLSVSTASPLPGATVGSAYSHSLAAAGGVPPYTWSILSDTPDTAAWLSISSVGLLTGTPSTAETETVVIQARDSTASLASKTFSLPVTGVALSITTTSPLPAGTVGIAYSQTMAASGGVAPYTWAITADTPDTGSWLSISTAGVLSGTPGTAETESLTIKVTDSMTTTVSAPFNLTIGVAAPALTYPRVMLVGDGGDQSYGCNTTNSYTPWLTAPAGNTSQTFIQQVGAWDAWIGSGVYETGTTTDWTNSGARDRDNLARALLKQSTTYSVKLNKSRPTLYFPYHVMCQGTAASGGGGYQQYITQVVGMGGWLFSLAGGAGTITPASDSGNLINYSSAYQTVIGNAQPGQSIVGTNYGTTSTGSPTGAQGIARTSGNYAAIKLLMPGYTGDTRFSFTSQMGSTNCAGVFLDNAFCALDGNGPVANSSLDGVTIAPGSQQGGGYPALDTTQVVLAHGNHNFCDQVQIMTTTYGSGNFYNFANLGQYANNYQFGTAPLTAGWSNANGGLIEATFGDGAASWEYFQTAGVNPSGWSAVRTNYYQGMAFCVQPVWWNAATMGTFQPLVGLHTILPATDGSFNASFAVNGTLTTVTTGTALEYQLMRYGLCTALLHNGMAAFGVLENNYAVTRWYDEFGDDSLTQVNVKRGYLGAPASNPPTAATWAQGALGVWSRTWANGLSIVNPRGNGSQTVALTGTYTKLLGTQQASVNNGATVTSVTLADGDGVILLGQPATGQLAAGHWQAAKLPMRLVYPQPDTATQTFARHRKAYYDGANPVEYRIPVGVQYGALPLIFKLLPGGPAGMTIGQAYGSANYGEVVWTPTAAVTNATVSVQIIDQAGATLTISWTVSTSSSTSDFIFVSTSGNDSTGTGSISAPYKTLNKVYGTTAAASTFPNRNLYLRAGTYVTYDATSGGYGIELAGGANPIAIMGFPGEAVTLNLAAAGLVSAFNTNGSLGNDLFLQNFTFSGGPASSGNFRICYLGQLQHRQTFHNVAAPNVWAGTAPSDNATMFYFNDGGEGVYRNYIYIKGCSETNRVSGNSFGITSMFVAQYVLIENCSCTLSAGQVNYFLKASCSDCTVRYNVATSSVATYPMGDGCQNNGLASKNYEYAYNTIVHPSGDASLSMNIQADTCGTHWVYRNSVIGSINCETPTGNGPFTMENNAIQTTGFNPVLISYANATLPSNVTNTGTECQGSSGILSTSTFLLIGTSRTNFLGQRGAEIG